MTNLVKKMLYSLILAITLLYANTNYITNNHIFAQLSLLTIQLSASSSHHDSIALSNLSLEQKYRNCLGDLQTLKQSLEAAILELNTCKAEEESINSRYERKSKVCDLLKDDYSKYCKSHNFKSPAFDKESCKTLLERIKECLKQKSSIGNELGKKTKECTELQRKVDERTSLYNKMDKKCSTIERELFKHRSQTSIRVVTQEDVMEKPVSALSEADVQSLMEVIQETRRSLQVCLEELNELSQRLVEKTDKMYGISEQITDALGGAISTKTKKKNKHKKKINRLEKDLKGLEEEKRGAMKLQFSKENECRNLQSKLRQAEERLKLAESRPTIPEDQGSRRGCFDRFTAFVSRTYRRITSRLRTRVTGRFSRNSRPRRSQTRF
ncbi:Signal peptide containing protein [Cryptosporidium meleagridis]